MPKQLTIGIDFDNTWTADDECLSLISDVFKSYNHTVIIATGRKEWTEDMLNYRLNKSIPIVFCGNEFKDIACKKAGYIVDIWIDDMPQTIRQQLTDNLE